MNGAFTVSELLIVVSMIVILSVLSLISFRSLRTEAMTREADEMAKSVFISIQNRISELKSSGKWEKERGLIVPEHAGEPIREEPSDFNYWLSLSGYDDVDSYSFGSSGNCIALGSVEDHDAVRELLAGDPMLADTVSSGQFYIEINPDAAALYSVIYAGAPVLSDYGEAAAFLNDGGRRNDSVPENEARHKRQSFENENGKMILGYYGGGIMADTEKATLLPPLVTVSNGEDLVLEIHDPNPLPTLIGIELKGLASGAVLRTGYDSSGMDLFHMEKTDEGLSIVLDSLIAGERDQRGQHIAGAFGDGFIPGEDLEIAVELRSGGDYLALPVTERVRTNSLFKAVEKGAIYIGSLRHLQNLSGEVSGFDAGLLFDGADTGNIVITDDISFSGEYLRAERKTRDYTAPENMMLLLDGSVAGGFYPIDLGGVWRIDGRGHRIYDLIIDPAERESAGLIGSAEILSIESLGIVSAGRGRIPEMTSSEHTHAAGSFAGRVLEITIRGCYSTMLHRHEGSGAGDVWIGGLAGYAAGSAVIENCYCGGTAPDGIYEKSPSNIQVVCSGSTVCAGGFIGGCGKADSENKKVRISSSYSTQSVGGILDNASGRLCIGGFAGALKGLRGEVNIDAGSYLAAPVTVQYRGDHSAERASVGAIAGRMDFSYPESSTAEIGSACLDFFAAACGNLTGDNLLKGRAVSINDLFADDGERKLGTDDTFPHSDGLAGRPYPFTDCTGLGHHFGDWQEHVPVSTVYIRAGNGILNISGSGWDGSSDALNRSFRFGESVDLDAIGFSLKAGYEGAVIMDEETGAFIRDEASAGSALRAGLDDMHLVVCASRLVTPSVTISGGGIYHSSYENAVLPVTLDTKYDTASDIRIHYEISYLEEGSDTPVIIWSEDKLLDQSMEDTYPLIIGRVEIDSGEYTGKRSYYVTSYVTDGILTSDRSEYGPVDVIFEKMRQKITFYSGKGWFYND